MRALPAIAPDLGTWHRVIVHSDCHVKFAHVLYSAPFGLVGKRLWLRATDGTASLYDDYRHVVTHPRGRRPGERVTVRDHLPPHAQAFFAHDRQWCLERAAGIGTACRDLIAHLLADRDRGDRRAEPAHVGHRGATQRRRREGRGQVAVERAGEVGHEHRGRRISVHPRPSAVPHPSWVGQA